MAHVLVANSDQALLDTIKMALRAAGYGVTTVHEPEALQVALALGPDVILLDLDPPDTVGVDVGTALLANPRTAMIPRIAMAGQYDEVMSLAGIAFDAWLPKPFELDELYDTLARWVRPSDGRTPAALSPSADQAPLSADGGA